MLLMSVRSASLPASSQWKRAEKRWKQEEACTASRKSRTQPRSPHAEFSEGEDEDSATEGATHHDSGGHSLGRSAPLLHRSELACGSIRTIPGAKSLEFRSVIRCGAVDQPKGRNWSGRAQFETAVF